MLIDFLHHIFNLLICLFVLRYAQIMLKDGPLDNALAFLLH
jgi:hypothetical protein